MALRNLVDMATYVHDASKEVTLHLTQLLISEKIHYLGRHMAGARAARVADCAARLGREQQHLD